MYHIRCGLDTFIIRAFSLILQLLQSLLLDGFHLVRMHFQGFFHMRCALSGLIRTLERMRFFCLSG